MPRTNDVPPPFGDEAAHAEMIRKAANDPSRADVIVAKEQNPEGYATPTKRSAATFSSETARESSIN
jgi:hypothetical protein